MSRKLKYSDQGDSYINLCLAVLNEARKADVQMWRDFNREYTESRRNCSPFGIAIWVGEWWRKDLEGLMWVGKVGKGENRGKIWYGGRWIEEIDYTLAWERHLTK